MTDPTLARMSRELATARRWATLLAAPVWQREEDIDQQRTLIRAPAPIDERLWSARDEPDR